MHRCGVCQVHSKTALCAGCQSLLTPPVNPCDVCAKPLNISGQVCGECRQKPPAFSKTFCATTYQSPINAWVHQLKFGERLDQARMMAEVMAPLLSDLPAEAQLVPVPLHQKRLRSRGYNQAHEIARSLAALLDRKLAPGMLQRARYTAMQAELPEKQRLANVRGAFAVSGDVVCEHVVLVDDVLTTGQTMRSAAKALHNAGVKTIEVAVFTRSRGF